MCSLLFFPDIHHIGNYFRTDFQVLISSVYSDVYQYLAQRFCSIISASCKVHCKYTIQNENLWIFLKYIPGVSLIKISEVASDIKYADGQMDRYTSISSCHDLGVVTVRRGMDWMIGFIDRFTTRSELQAIIALLLIHTLYNSPLHTHTSVLSLH
jgi:hypothetical protein